MAAVCRRADIRLFLVFCYAIWVSIVTTKQRKNIVEVEEGMDVIIRMLFQCMIKCQK